MERSQLELYAQVISAYQQADIWHLFKYAYVKSGNKLRAKGKFWIVGLPILAIVIYVIVSMFSYCIGMSNYIIDNVLFSLCILAAIEILEINNISNKLKRVFAGEMSRYTSLAKIYGEGWEFCRYILFRNELKKSQLKSEHVKNVVPLFDLDQQTLGSYVAQRPLMIWISSTLTAILAASATSWHPSWVVLAVVIGGVTMGVLLFLPINRHRRRYELHRWLAWYEADDPKPTASTPDGATPATD